MVELATLVQQSAQPFLMMSTRNALSDRIAGRGKRKMVLQLTSARNVVTVQQTGSGNLAFVAANVMWICLVVQQNQRTSISMVNGLKVTIAAEQSHLVQSAHAHPLLSMQMPHSMTPSKSVPRLLCRRVPTPSIFIA